MREYQESDEERIRELRGISLSGPKDSQWWHWMYRNGPAGPAMAWIAEVGNKIVGHTAGLPVRMKVKNLTCMRTGKPAVCPTILFPASAIHATAGPHGPFLYIQCHH